MRVILETERLMLRELERTDADDLARTLCDRENMRFYEKEFTRSDVDLWIERCKERYATHGTALWAVVLKSDAQFIGDCGLIPQIVDGVDETEIGYHLERAYQGRGLATEAARACRDYGFHQLGRKRLISLIRPENTPSQRVAQRNGMVVERETVWAGLPHLVYVALPDAAGVR